MLECCLQILTLGVTSIKRGENRHKHLSLTSAEIRNNERGKLYRASRFIECMAFHIVLLLHSLIMHTVRAHSGFLYMYVRLHVRLSVWLRWSICVCLCLCVTVCLSFI